MGNLEKVTVVTHESSGGLFLLPFAPFVDPSSAVALGFPTPEVPPLRKGVIFWHCPSFLLLEIQPLAFYDEAER